MRTVFTQPDPRTVVVEYDDRATNTRRRREFWLSHEHLTDTGPMGSGRVQPIRESYRGLVCQRLAYHGSPLYASPTHDRQYGLLAVIRRAYRAMRRREVAP